MGHILQAVICTMYMRMNTTTLRWHFALRALEGNSDKEDLLLSNAQPRATHLEETHAVSQPGHATNANGLMSKHPHLCSSQNEGRERRTHGLASKSGSARSWILDGFVKPMS